MRHTQAEVASTCRELCRICVESEIIVGDVTDDVISMDLVQSAKIDSMMLVYMQAAIEDRWGVEIPPALFVTKLRTLEQIATHIVATRSTPVPVVRSLN